MRSHLSRALVFVMSVLASVATSAPNARAAVGDVSEWSLPFGAAPTAIAAGPDGNLWVAERLIDAVVRVAPGGGVAGSVDVPGGPWGVAAGGGGYMWVTERNGMNVARIGGDGSVTEFPIPLDTSTSDRPMAITRGPDGAMWFVEQASNEIGRIARDGTVIEYAIPTPGSKPFGIAAGPDGNLWFTEQATNRIGRIAPDGSFLPEIPLPFEGSSPLAIANGGDGGMWVAGSFGGGLLRIDASTLDVQVKASGLAEPTGVAAGPDDAIWWTERRGQAIGRFDLRDGTWASFADPAQAGPFWIAAGPDGNVWFTGTDGATVGRVEADHAPRDTTSPTITLNVPQDGAAYVVGDAPVADFSCADEEGGSGLATCAGPVPSGGVIDTSVPGVFAFTVTASDQAGNTASVSHAYVVFKEWGGRLELPPTLNRVTAGSAVPIWFSFGPSSAVSVRSFATSPTTTQIDCGTLQSVGSAIPASVSPAGPRGSTGRVMYVWRTKPAWAGTCRTFTLGLAAPTSVYIAFV